MRAWIKYVILPMIKNKCERLAMAIAWSMPKWLVYWCSIRLGANATTGEYSSQIVPDLTFMEALERWTSTKKQAS